VPNQSHTQLYRSHICGREVRPLKTFNILRLTHRSNTPT
jgi:hypothetical protein